MAKRLALWIAFLAVVLGLAPTAHALEDIYDDYVRLADGWRIQLGNDQVWAARDFDDSGWLTGSTAAARSRSG